MYLENNRFKNTEQLILKKLLEDSSYFIKHEKYNMALTLFEKLDKKYYKVPEIQFNIGISYFLLGKKYLEMKQLVHAINYYEKAESYFKLLSNENALVDIYIKIAHCYQYSRKFDKMKDAHEKLVKLDKRPAISEGLLCYSKLCCAINCSSKSFSQ